MKKLHISNKRVAVLCCVVSCALFLYSTGVQAEYRCGFFVLMSPPSKDVERDFSELTDSCSDFGGLDTCAVVLADIRFLQNFEMSDSVYASVGILDLGEFDSTGLQNLDTVPTTGYADHAILVFHHMYAVKTTEEHYAALFYDYQFIGGINRYGFAWAYQSDGTNIVSSSVDAKKGNTLYTLRNKYYVKVIPLSTGVKISWQPFNGLAAFDVFNSSGQKVEVVQADGRNGYCISTLSLSKGLYFVKSNFVSDILSVVLY